MKQNQENNHRKNQEKMEVPIMVASEWLINPHTLKRKETEILTTSGVTEVHQKE